jgi:uridine phosphorylase
MTDALLERLTYEPTDKSLTPIPWPKGLEPTVVKYKAASDAPLPKVDVVVSAFTFAEGEALSAVLSPGHSSTDWIYYTKDFDAYESQLTKESKRLLSYSLVTIGAVRVLLVKLELHPATDGPTLPTAQLWHQIITETGAKTIVTHGTAGAVQSTTILGDVIIAAHVRWDCQGQFKSESWADDEYACTPLTEMTPNLTFAQETLIPVNSGRLAPIATRAPVIWLGFDTITTDFFAFDDAENHYGLRTYDSNARAVEMDDAACGVAMQHIGVGAPKWYSIRNASDPQMPQGASIEAEDSAAAKIYQDKGFTTTVGSAIACWALVADLN